MEANFGYDTTWRWPKKVLKGETMGKGTASHERGGRSRRRRWMGRKEGATMSSEVELRDMTHDQETRYQFYNRIIEVRSAMHSIRLSSSDKAYRKSDAQSAGKR